MSWREKGRWPPVFEERERLITQQLAYERRQGGSSGKNFVQVISKLLDSVSWRSRWDSTDWNR